MYILSNSKFFVTPILICIVLTINEICLNAYVINKKLCVWVCVSEGVCVFVCSL